MGSRGASSGRKTSTYKPYKYGQITKYEAGTIYRASKDGKIKVLPETTRTLYNDTEAYLPYAQQRYSQDYLYYDRIYSATEHIKNGDFKKAQKEITQWEKDVIKRSGKKSPFYKYK